MRPRLMCVTGAPTPPLPEVLLGLHFIRTDPCKPSYVRMTLCSPTFKFQSRSRPVLVPSLASAPTLSLQSNDSNFVFRRNVCRAHI